MKDNILSKVIECTNNLLDNYDSYALLINACSVSSKYYTNREDSVAISTTGNVPSELLTSVDIIKIYNKEKLIGQYTSSLLMKISKDYLVTTVGILDALLEDIYEIVLRKTTTLDDRKISKKIVFSESSLPSVLFEVIPNLKGRKNPKGHELNDFLNVYEQLRQVRHAVVHCKGDLQERHINKINKLEEALPDEMKVTKSGMLDGNKVKFDLFNMVFTRYWALTFISFLHVDLAECL